MSLFDAAYDNMSWEEVSYRLPGDLAIKALKRRLTNLDTMLVFFASCGTNANNIREIKQHVNSILNDHPTADILAKFTEQHKITLFGWLDDANKARLKNEGRDSMDLKLLFNMTDAKDGEGLYDILDRILNAPELKPSMALSVLHKADVAVFPRIINRVMRDQRDEIRSLVLCVGSTAKQKMVGDNVLLVGLKSMARLTSETRATDVLDFNLFAQLKAGERLTVLKRYLAQFPHYRKVSPFAKRPTEEELDLTLFAGCIEQNDLVVELKDLYNKIANDDPPQEEAEEP